MGKTIIVKDWKEAAQIVTGLNDEEFKKLYDEWHKLKYGDSAPSKPE